MVREKDGVRVTIMDAEMYKRLPAKGQDDSVAQSSNKSAILAKIDYVYPHTSQAVPSKIASSSLDAHKFDLNEDAQTNSFSWESLVDEDENKQLAEGKKQLGSAYHKVYETINYDADIDQINQHVQRLLDQRLLDINVAQFVDTNLIYQTLSNPTFKQIVSSGKVYHEMPFLMPVNYSEFDPNGSDATTLLQGVIDMLVVCKDKAIVVDFKFTSNSYKLQERYQKQLQSYRKAVEEIIGLPVDCYLLSIADNKLIQIN